jgi:threonylcarbamoyladenosine tRNA methylthiotransferase MtaB
MNKVINFGCRLNNFEGKKIEELLPQKGKPVIVINSCAVTNETERQVRQTIRKIKKQNPNSKLVLTGCAAQISPSDYKQMKEVDHLVDNINKLKPEAWNNIFEENKEDIFIKDIFDEVNDAAPTLQGESHKARESLVIQQGCNHRCTFCIIPFGRGNNRSFDPRFLINEVKRNVDSGVKEIVLTGVDISDYGSDFNNHYCMSKLIMDILNETNLKRIRLSSIDCVEIDKHFDQVIQDPRVMPHLHLSIQAGDNMILKRMKRRHNVDDVRNFVQRCRSLRKDITFGADIIAGFPTETEEMFYNTYKLLKECKISHLHIFPFSPKENTPAARMPQLQKSIIKQRAQKLRQLGEELLDEVKKEFYLPRKVLIEEVKTGAVVGYDQNYIKHQIPMIGLPIGEIVTA